MMKMKYRKYVFLLSFLFSALILGIVGCSATHRSSPNPTDENIVNGTNSHIIQEPNGYRNVAFQCFGPNGVYVSSRSTVDTLPSSIFVVVNDPQCK